MPRRTHGHSNVGNKATKEYNCWLNIKQRCHNPNHHKYPIYGGRGIIVCDEWRNDFEAFYAHIGDAPGPSYSIDRIDVDGNYEPGNVRWATKSQQAINTRIYKSNTTGYKGVTKTKWNTWQARINVNKKRINLGSYSTLEEAVEVRRQAEEKYYKD